MGVGLTRGLQWRLPVDGSLGAYRESRPLGLEVVLRQPQAIITSYVCVNQASSPRAFAKSFDDHSSSNIVVF
eukprot:1137973-Pelagomonas_calceolata.AAC.1